MGARRQGSWGDRPLVALARPRGLPHGARGTQVFTTPSTPRNQSFSFPNPHSADRETEARRRETQTQSHEVPWQKSSNQSHGRSLEMTEVQAL